MWRRILGTGATAAVTIVGVLAGSAAAAPETPVSYPAGSSATTYEGLGFDTCTAPSLAAMRAWTSTAPYDTVNIYFGGNNRGCAQPNLTRDWVRTVNLLGWKILPTYMGHQPFCMLGSKPNRFTEATATRLGTADAQDAVTRAGALGLLPGSALYADVEHYDRSNASCRTAVRRYVSAWTTTLHGAGYLAGVYAHQDSGLRDLADTYTSTTYARPDAVWMARWDGNPDLTGWPTADDEQWGFWQRAKQYRGDHHETWGGVNARTGPGTSFPVSGEALARGALAYVVCQATGTTVGSTAVWNTLSDGRWVTDYYVANGSNTTWSTPVPRCT